MVQRGQGSAGPALRPADLNGGRLFQRGGFFPCRKQDNPNPGLRLEPSNLKNLL
jgi:hypothetical protein